MDSLQELRDQLSKRIRRSRNIVEGLENYEPFKMLLEDFNASVQAADNNWHLIPFNEMWKLEEERIRKLAALSIINIIDTYKHDLATAEQKLVEIDHPTEVQSSYYDPE